MKKGVEKPLVVLLFVNGKEPSSAEFQRKNRNKIEVVSIEIPMQMGVIPIIECWRILLNERVTEFNGKIPLKQDIKKVDNYEIDHCEVNDKQSCSPLVFEF